MKHRYLIAGIATCLVAVGAAGCIATAQADGAAAAAAAPAAAAPAALSFTAAQVASGKDEYTASCVDCHGPHLNDGEFGGPPLIGDAFKTKWFGKPANGLVGYISSAMPLDAPGRLPMGTYVEIVAYILNANGIAPGTKEIPADLDALGKLNIPVSPAAPATP